MGSAAWHPGSARCKVRVCFSLLCRERLKSVNSFPPWPAPSLGRVLGFPKKSLLHQEAKAGRVSLGLHLGEAFGWDQPDQSDTGARTGCCTMQCALAPSSCRLFPFQLQQQDLIYPAASESKMPAARGFWRTAVVDRDIDAVSH